ncbi:MAG: hypothetical protein LBB14_02570 [Puniceicoccales bacterium]|jgi:hypothetical protein|nr:hypothetical protein [Puniceicoccales bacterium]
MPEFTENRESAAGEERGPAPSQRRPRRRRNPIVGSRGGRDGKRSQTAPIGPCTIDAQPAIVQSSPSRPVSATGRGKYSTEMARDEAADGCRKPEERRFRRKTGERDGAGPRRQSGNAVARRSSGADSRPAAPAPAAPAAGPVERIFRALWPFGKKKSGPSRQERGQGYRDRPTPNRRRDA